MNQHRPFRFGIQGRTTGPRDEWIGMVRRVEALGYSTFLAMDHFVRGLDPVASLMAAAMATTTLRVGGFVFDNDFRHPAVLAKAAATIDVLSGGRLELGIGAGWLKEEYDQTGIPFDPARVRIDRMVEAVHLIKRIFGDEPPVSFTGQHYTVTDLVSPPRPVQQPHPPIMIGGGGQRLLTVAAQEADIVGITSRARADGTKDPADITAAATDRKIGWVRETAGERFSEIELNAVIGDVIVTDDPTSEAACLAERYGLSADDVLDSPLVLIGTPDGMAERLEERRERFGISYVVVTEPHIDALAPVVARLAGR